jgi:hypothetical protein
MGILRAGQPWSLRVAAALSNKKGTALSVTWVKKNGSTKVDTDLLMPGSQHDNGNAKVPKDVKRVYVFVDLPQEGAGDIVVNQQSLDWAEHLLVDTQWVFDVT